MDNTLRAILSELFACSTELDKLRAQVAQLTAELEAARGPAIQPH